MDKTINIIYYNDRFSIYIKHMYKYYIRNYLLLVWDFLKANSGNLSYLVQFLLAQVPSK